ncbi:hypothetical protein [Nostoc sp. PCC 7107]|uniref:hypothetical protein n=1 Tax=Nostoc sp. PCC 7107 TaxID=317936 RepID=UPI0002D37AE3|nr:hypothetical protein [Nostoc sp. PCC 7107]
MLRVWVGILIIQHCDRISHIIILNPKTPAMNRSILEKCEVFRFQFHTSYFTLHTSALINTCGTIV